MDWDRIQQKLHILSDAAKYDVSCSSSGSRRANQAGGIGNGAVCGICHTWSADGRCVSLLKILMTNRCIYDCAYCVNAASREAERAILTPEEIADVTIAFYRAITSKACSSVPASIVRRTIRRSSSSGRPASCGTKRNSTATST